MDIDCPVDPTTVLQMLVDLSSVLRFGNHVHHPQCPESEENQISVSISDILNDHANVTCTLCRKRIDILISLLLKIS